MRGLLQIVVLEWRALIRTGVLPALWLFAFLWTYFAPLWLVSDGTDEGAREIFLTYGVGTVFVLALIAFGASAAGALSKERAAKRLQLSLVRPVPAFVLAWGRMLAHTAGFATVVAVALGAAALHGDGARPAYHVRHPILQTPAEEAREAYAGYMRSAETPEAVKKMKKDAVLRILEQKSFERYETIPANATAVWRFPLPTGGKASRASSSRVCTKRAEPCAASCRAVKRAWRYPMRSRRRFACRSPALAPEKTHPPCLCPFAIRDAIR